MKSGMFEPEEEWNDLDHQNTADQDDRTEEQNLMFLYENGRLTGY